MSDNFPKSDESRLTRVEAGLETLTQDVSRLTGAVERIAGSIGRPNYSLLAIIVSMTGLAAGVIYGPIAANKEGIHELKAEHSAWITREQERNNALEYKAGRAEMIHELFMAGRLKMTEQ